MIRNTKLERDSGGMEKYMKRKKMNSLTSLRFLMMSMIVFSHMGFWKTERLSENVI